MSTGPGFSGEAPGVGEPPPETEDGTASGRGDDGTFADVLNGFSLDSGRRRKRKKSKESQDSPVADAADGSSQPTDLGDRVTSVVSPPANTESLIPAGGLFVPGPPVPDYSPDYPSFTGYTVPADRHPGDDVHPGEETAIVRPYALTGGRTKSNYALELETLVSTKESVAIGAISDAAVGQIESLSIMEECRSPRSVAEIAAFLRVPLGVARVLISDAADAGLVTVHKTISDNDGAEAHLVLMERVLSGLRRL
ncbi:MAG: hypothetical protein QOI21_3453 [Actinomycetota bacterium]|jgi:hypothetical protein|nr:hypothetical protein [Actinomycetota bacterium]